MSDKIIIFWFRQDLRISDNPGLLEAAKNGIVMPIYILDDESCDNHKMGGASRWWLHHSLGKLNQSLENKLNVYSGDSKKVLLEIIKNNGGRIGSVFWNRCYEPWRIKNDTEIKVLLKNLNIECKSFNGSLLWEPWEILKSDRTFYKVFTAFYQKGCLQTPSPRHPLPKPKKLTLMLESSQKSNIDSLQLLPRKKWYNQIEKKWAVGENAAQKRLKQFLSSDLLGYKENRDYPSKPNVSKLSPYLHFGEISPHQVWHSLLQQSAIKSCEKDAEHFLREIGWREFSYYLLYHFPALPRQNFHAKFDHFPWLFNAKFLKAWQKGQTGYPIIDAGMRELWQTGYMHNRVRMIVASFLTKNLLLHWHHGEDWFWDCLLDADLANNSASWQWVAGSGVDAAPYFRIFNPVTQGEKFDSEGKYTRLYVPELNRLENKFLHKPWEAPEQVLKAAGIILGKTYPKPIIDLKQTRERALQAYQTTR
jgi:deoxyribodipyrimidine photo-lyase